MNRRFAHTAQDYQSQLIEAANEEGYDVVLKDGAAYLRLTVVDETGAEHMTEINLTRFAVSMAGRLS